MPDVEVHWDWPALPDETFVVRGERDWRGSALWANANQVFLEAGVWGICVGAAEGASDVEIAQRMPYRGDWLRTTRLGDIRAAGFDLVQIDKPKKAHAIFLLNDEPTGDDWDGWERLPPLFGAAWRIPEEG